MKRAVFLDRDGVLVKNIDNDYIRDSTQIELLPHAKESVIMLHEAGYELIIVTNQAAVNKKLISIEKAWNIQNTIINMLDPNQSLSIKSEICPHTVEEQCICRKPNPGMILAAKDKYDIDIESSYLIGDASSDIQAAQSAGIKPILVLSGRGTRSEIKKIDSTVEVFEHVGEASNYICKRMAR